MLTLTKITLSLATKIVEIADISATPAGHPVASLILAKLTFRSFAGMNDEYYYSFVRLLNVCTSIGTTTKSSVHTVHQLLPTLLAVMARFHEHHCDDFVDG